MKLTLVYALLSEHENTVYSQFCLFTKNECSGHRLDDVTVFSDLVPYTDEQEKGSRHTWRHIFRMWHYDLRDYRFVVNNGFGNLLDYE